MPPSGRHADRAESGGGAPGPTGVPAHHPNVARRRAPGAPAL